MDQIITAEAERAFDLRSAEYRECKVPFSHIYFDDFFCSDVACYLYEKFPKMEEMPVIFNEPMSYKGQLSDIDGKWPQFSAVFSYLQSSRFLELLTRLTGIPDLIADPILAGGGLHQSPRSGFLDIHVDANFHPIDKSLHRRINIIIYLNKDWDCAWGGDLQFWSDEGNRPGEVKSTISPLFNRAAIFNTTRTSWHGVSPVVCPPDQSRKSLALYYYTKSRPSEEVYADSSVIWMNKDNFLKRVTYPVLNFLIRLAKPYARFFRRSVFDAAQKHHQD